MKCPFCQKHLAIVVFPAAPMPIPESTDSLGLGLRAKNALICKKVTTITELQRCSLADLFQLRNCGENTVEEIRMALAYRGLYLRGDPKGQTLVTEIIGLRGGEGI